MQEVELGKRLAERAQLQPREARGCPEPDLLAALATGEVQEGEREVLLAHLEGCPDCASEVAAAVAASELVADRQGRVGLPATARPRPATHRRWLQLAAVLVLVAGGTYMFRLSGGSPAEWRGDESARWAVVPGDGVELDAPPGELTWPEVAGAQAYEVELFDAAFTRLARSGELSLPRFELPSDLRLARGSVYFWRVEVKGGRDAPGRRLFSFRLSP